jgi:hypothetical protein
MRSVFRRRASSGGFTLAFAGYGSRRVGKRVIGKEMEPDVRVTASTAEAS